MSRITSIHGFNKLKKNGGTSKLWAVVMLGNLLITIAYLLVIKQRYHDDNIITRVNANCKINQVPFPSVSICNYNMISHKRSLILRNILRSYNVTQREIDLFLETLPSLMDYHQTRAGHFAEILDILKKHYFTIETIMEESHQHCEDLLVYCTFNRKLKNCNKIFSLIKTYEGYCCAFNYAALNDHTDQRALDGDDGMEQYDDMSSGKQTSIVVTSESGRSSGLRVIFDVEPSDYLNWSSPVLYGAKILINDPNDYPELTVLYKRIYTGESLNIKVEPYVFQSEENLRGIELARRGCVFHDEVKLKHTDRYSTETCTTECRMKSFLKHCNCVPYKYPIDPGTRICEFKDLECLNNLRAKGFAKERCEPACYLECRDKRYSITGDVTPLVAELYPPDVTNGRDASRLCALRVYFDKPTCNCYKQILFTDFISFIATYGGIFSLSFGASLLTLCEINYLIITIAIRWVWKSVQARDLRTDVAAPANPVITGHSH